MTEPNEDLLAKLDWDDLIEKDDRAMGRMMDEEEDGREDA
jgi:hypothetical protein